MFYFYFDLIFFFSLSSHFLGAVVDATTANLPVCSALEISLHLDSGHIWFSNRLLLFPEETGLSLLLPSNSFQLNYNDNPPVSTQIL